MSSPVGLPSGACTEFEILKESHRFLRPTDESEADAPWEDRLARKYYDSLYREYAVCDLKHYKSGNFSLRWRTENEVLSGTGEETCANTRCPLHNIEMASLAASLSTEDNKKQKRLSTLELPFVYQEQGESKAALVKVVLCPRCVKKIMWKRRKDKEAQQALTEGVDKPHEKEEEDSEDAHEPQLNENASNQRAAEAQKGKESGHHPRLSTKEKWQERTSRRRSRSRSPHRRDLSRSKRTSN